jgi:two-component system NtrC family sensor kinase
MKPRGLRTQIFFSFFTIILIFALAISFLGVKIINDDIIARAQRQIEHDIGVARVVFNGEIDAIKTAFNLIPADADFAEVKSKLGLDYLYRVSRAEEDTVKSEIVRKAFSGVSVGGIRIVERDELSRMGGEFIARNEINVRSTLKSRPTTATVLDRAMVIGYAMPVFDEHGTVASVMYGGKILNRNFALVDKIRDLVFENRLYGGKPVGTVTIFLDDVRIATNVLDEAGQRAIGTMVSETVYKKVLLEGQSWLDRAFVVTDWYLTAYEPLKNINNQTIGMLYVGTLEAPFRDLGRKILLIFLAIILAMSVLGIFLSYALAVVITRPLVHMLEATGRISHGDLSHRLEISGSIVELNRLAESFNDMSGRLKEREESLKVTNEKLAQLNASYLDLVGFVSHELKGILGSLVMTIYALKDGLLGELNAKQKSAVDASARNLGHFENMVRNYLDLSRIEKGELTVHKATLDLNDDVIGPALRNFERQMQERNVKVENMTPAGITLRADRNLLLIVFNNLLSNALKYGDSNGLITIDSLNRNGEVVVKFFNQGPPINEAQKELLFKKFSRLPGSDKIRGTGLGLFIVKQILERHGGAISLEPGDRGNTFVLTLRDGN